MTRLSLGLVWLAMLGWLAQGTAVAAVVSAESPSVAFYYGNSLPTEILNQYDWVVLESAHADERDLREIRRYGAEVFAYVSVGEAEAWRQDTGHLPDTIQLGKNKAWNSEVMDLTRPVWREYLLEERVRPLWEAGYRGLFLDTLDSFHLFLEKEADIEAQWQALAGFIKTLRREFPGIQLILNRGFPILDEVYDDIRAVAAESLYQRWDAGRQAYTDVPEAEREYLLKQLQSVRNDHGLPAISIDYVPPSERDKARATARKIAEHGIIPWVSTPALDQAGIGLIEPLPRRVLVLYNAAELENGDLANSSGHLYLAAPLEYLGYGAEYVDVGGPLPSDTLAGRYAGIVSWFDEDIADAERYREWLLKQMNGGVPVALFGDPGISLSGELAQAMGLKPAPSLKTGPASIVRHDDMVGFEGMRASNIVEPAGVSVSRDDVEAHVVMRDAAGTEYTPVVTGNWGGFASYGWLIEQGMPSQERWLLNPFRFLRKALQLPDMPVPDATTENGSRYLITHIDGDGMVSQADLPGTPYNGQVILDRILERYRVPTTVSIIQGETGPEGLYPEQSQTVEAIARKIFQLSWVEIATHTFSHPFEWHSLEQGVASGEGQTSAGFNYNLPIPGYHYSLEKEIAGSTQYINEQLAPADKKTRVVLWTGDAQPSAEALAIAEREGLLNLNGGNTSATNDNPSLTAVWPMLRPQGKYLQVYAPQINENVYTNDMTAPLWGYRRVIETYQITNQPRRLKPINIYYHFYSAGSPALLSALHEVYGYALEQEIQPVYVSTYSRTAQNWYRLGVARRLLDESWQITGAEANRTLRLPESLGWPDLQRSQGVAGVRDLEQGRYLALTGEPKVNLVLQSQPTDKPHLVRANGRIVKWQQDGGHIEARLQSEVVPLEVELGAIDGCRVDAGKAWHQRRGDHLLLKYKTPDSGLIEVHCG